MSNKPRKSKKSKPKNTNTVQTKKKGFSFKRRHLTQLGFLAVIATPVYFASAAYLKKQEALHDLSVLNEGKSVLVQIHDPTCPSCRRLLGSVNSVLKEFPHIEFRIANLQTPKGSAFAGQHRLGKVSLVHLSRTGKVTKETGLQSEEEVRDFLKGVR